VGIPATSPDDQSPDNRIAGVSRRRFLGYVDQPAAFDIDHANPGHHFRPRWRQPAQGDLIIDPNSFAGTIMQHIEWSQIGPMT
jgi:hypothetical protein